MGKSFWSSVLTHQETREAVAPRYPRLPLDRIQAVLGFHEDAGKDDGPAPSPAMLASLYNQGHAPESIWRAVLVKALSEKADSSLPSTLKDIIAWNAADVSGRKPPCAKPTEPSFKRGRYSYSFLTH